jgi:hypothetical protein
MESANIAADYLAKAIGREGLPGWPDVPRAPGLTRRPAATREAGEVPGRA